MRGILADKNNEGHVGLLIQQLQTPEWVEIWTSLNLQLVSFGQIGLDPEASDLSLWQASQKQEIVLITINRNADGPESLGQTIRDHNSGSSLPVLTLANANRLLHDRAYLERTVQRLLEILIDIDNYRGCGRLFLP